MFLTLTNDENSQAFARYFASDMAAVHLSFMRLHVGFNLIHHDILFMATYSYSYALTDAILTTLSLNMSYKRQK